jgi:hypothetical protein
MEKTILTLTALLALLINTGCQQCSISKNSPTAIAIQQAAANKTKTTADQQPHNPVFHAPYTTQPVKIDGKLDEHIWQKATAYRINFSKDVTDRGEKIKQGGTVRFAWDDKYFYVAAALEDSDVVAQGKENQMHHYKYGDLCELFLKPVPREYYWELYVTPAGKKSSFFFPSKGYLGLPGCLENYNSGLKVAAKTIGTLNNWQNEDKGWAGEMAMPINDLEEFGYQFKPGSEWTILIGRYNYSVHLPAKELSMAPQLSNTSFHLTDQYAKLKLTSKK